MENKIEKLKTFIKENNLSFNEGERNSNIVILCGFALFNENILEECKEVIPKEFIDTLKKETNVFQEIERVYYYADSRNYKKYWGTAMAQAQYKF